MAKRYIERSIEPVLRRAAGEFPSVVLTGPRQSGKTTMLQHLFAGSHRYVSLETPDFRTAATEDPRGFLDAYPPPVILDEIQYTPDILQYVKERIDERRDVPGQYLLTGSQNLLLMEKVTESLAGRAATLRLLQMSRREEDGDPRKPFPWEEAEAGPASRARPVRRMWKDFVRGSYPELVADPSRDVALWQAGYVQTYLERDVRTIRQVGDLSQFQVFLRALAARSAQLLNMADLARDLGLALNTVKAWISVLEASYQIIVLRPYYANIGRRLVKTPKVYFTDTGTLCSLTRLKDPEHAAAGPLGGAIMETAVLMEIVKGLTNRGAEPHIYFWRTADGLEVDIVAEDAQRLVPIEVKLSATPRSAMAATLKSFREGFGDSAGPGYVVHPGGTRLPLGDGITALPFGEL